MLERRVFLSYCHEDSDLKDEFLKHFAILRRSGIASVWHDRELIAGHPFKAEILEQIDHSDVFVFLISAAFISSKFCWGTEMRAAIDLAREGNLNIVGIVIREVDFAGAPFEHQLLLPPDAKAVTSPHWSNRDQAWTAVIKELRRVCSEAGPKRPTTTTLEQSTDSYLVESREASESEPRNSVRLVEPELVRPEGLTEMVGLIEVEFLGAVPSRGVCDLQLFLNTNVTSRLLTHLTSETRLAFKPFDRYPLDRSLKPHYASPQGANSLMFQRLPVGEIRARYGRAVARISGLRVNANQLNSDSRVVVAFKVPQFGDRQVKQSDLAHFAPPLKVKLTWQHSGLRGILDRESLIDFLDQCPDHAPPVLFRVQFTTYFGRWEIPGQSTRLGLRIVGLPNGVDPIFTTGSLAVSDPAMSARLVKSDANGSGEPVYLQRTTTLSDTDHGDIGGHLGAGSGGYALAVWEVQDAALLATQTVEVGVGLAVDRSERQDAVTVETIAPRISGFLAPISTNTTASMSAPAPRFADSHGALSIINP